MNEFVTMEFETGTGLKHYYFEPADVFVFPVIDWHYRFQRPQQIATRLAMHGHRVFYLRTYFLKGNRPAIQPVRDDLPLFHLQLGLPAEKNLVTDQLDERSKSALLEQCQFLRETQQISKAICIVDLPFWGPLVLELQRRYGWKVIYNAMDQLGGFSNVTSHMLEPEAELVEKSDLVLATSHLLFEEKSRLNPNCLLVPNGTEFDHFNTQPERAPEELSRIQKPVIGYYGAMSDWLDTELIGRLASARPGWSFVLIGRVDSADVSGLRRMSNVHLVDEKPYELLPGYLHRFDVGIIPFKKSPLTEATNPVKLFEYLSAGKPVVATDLNELRHYRDYVRLASSAEEWLEAIERALEDAPARVEVRQGFARQNTWDERLLSIEDALLAMAWAHGSAPLPLILPEENLLSARLLTHHEGRDYWSLVYEKDGVTHRQASFDLAAREGQFLSLLRSDYFPELLDVRSQDGYSVIAYRKIQGLSLAEARAAIGASAAEFHGFARHCLSLLMELRDRGIIHRNISRETLLVRDGKPVLLDFAWAVSEEAPYFSPAGLGGYERPPDGLFSDVYSMGKILEYINRRQHLAFDRVISLMTNKHESLRITDLSVLKSLFQIALENQTDGTHYAPAKA
jgi:glycosyltransferase involved in cell wall biosynthesis